MTDSVSSVRWCAISATVGAICAAILGAGCATPAATGSPPVPSIQIDDVNRFYRVYEDADGRPTADELQHDYLDPGSDGLHRFAKARNISGTTIADAMLRHPEIYSGAKRCMVVLPQVRERLVVALGKLFRLDPEARNAPVTIGVGRGRPVAIGSPDGGVQVGLEALCATNWLNLNVEDRFVHVIAHEYAHVQQAQVLTDDQNPTVLERSLVEGIAEFTAELISGEVAYSQFAASTKGHEREIESAFVADEDKTDLSDWIDNSTPEKPRDLGYWVGYRITKSYYQNATDKRQAVREILEMTNPKALLANSGWYPGIQLR